MIYNSKSVCEPKDMPDGESWAIFYLSSYDDGYGGTTHAWNITVYSDLKSLTDEVARRCENKYSSEYFVAKVNKANVTTTVKIDIDINVNRQQER